MNLSEIALRPGKAESRAAKPAFLTAGGAVTNRQFQDTVFRSARELAAVGVKPGERIVLRMTNSVEFAASFLATIWLGAIPVLQNSQFGKEELGHIFGLTQPSLVLLGAPFARQGDAAGRSGCPQLYVDRDGLTTPSGERIAADSRTVVPVHDADPDDDAFIVFTSGSTGHPKGVVHGHRWLEALAGSNRRRLPPQDNDVILATGEWSFISALGHNMLFPLLNGVAGSVMEERASPERILETIARDGVTVLHSVATLYRRILGHPGIERRYDLTSLRAANSTGEPLEDAIRNEWQARVGCPVWEHYGVSEAQMVLGDGPGVPHRHGSVGKSWGAPVRIVDADLKPLPAGTAGTLAFDATYPGFFKRYLGDPRLTETALRERMFVTSDLARIDDDGYVFILGRSDDCFKSKGVLIVPSEIEQALMALGHFEEVCVFPVAHHEVGNDIAVAVVLRTEAADWDAGGLGEELSGKIASFKVPRKVFPMSVLPKNANGKTQRKEVRKAVVALDESA
jgi:acyl-coenzyme A synthetase/AMP-(fatty) acid ligase